MRYFNRQLAANANSTIAARGTFIWLKSSTGRVQLKTSEGETAVLAAGDFHRMDKEFTDLYLEDLSGAQNDLVVVVSGQGEAGKYGNVTIDTPAVYSDVADVSILATTATLILAANSNRNEAIITSLSTNTADARIGSSSVAAARGTPLVPGATLFLNTTAAIYAYSTAACDFAINWTEFA